MRFCVAQGLAACCPSAPAAICISTNNVAMPRAPLATGGTAAAGGSRAVHLGQQRLSSLRTAAATSSQTPCSSAARSGGKGAANGSSNGSGNNADGGGPVAAESRRSGSGGGGGRVTARLPRIPPLPYWCDGVAVVGLPGDELVFCFQTPTQASATARRQLRPEARYGASAGWWAGRPCTCLRLAGDKDSVPSGGLPALARRPNGGHSDGRPRSPAMLLCSQARCPVG